MRAITVGMGDSARLGRCLAWAGGMLAPVDPLDKRAGEDQRELRAIMFVRALLQAGGIIGEESVELPLRGEGRPADDWGRRTHTRIV